MSKHFPRLALTLALAGAATLAQAQDWKNFYIKGGFASPQGDSRDMTKQSKGFTFELGYVMAAKAWEGDVRFYLGYVKMGGDKKFKPWVSGERSDGSLFWLPYDAYSAPIDNQADYTIKEQKFAYDMTGHTIGIDFVFPFKVKGQNISIFTGPSLHAWYMVKVNPLEPQTDRNLKAGWRLGGTWQYDQHLDFSVAYTATEWHSAADTPFEQGANPGRPSYLSLTAGYRF